MAVEAFLCCISSNFRTLESPTFLSCFYTVFYILHWQNTLTTNRSNYLETQLIDRKEHQIQLCELCLVISTLFICRKSWLWIPYSLSQLLHFQNIITMQILCLAKVFSSLIHWYFVLKKYYRPHRNVMYLNGYQFALITNCMLLFICNVTQRLYVTTQKVDTKHSFYLAF